MSDARAAILDRLRRHAGSDDTLAMPPALPVRRFDWDLDERLHRFRHMLETVRGEVHLAGDDWPALLARLLREKGVGTLRYGPDAPLAGELMAGWPPAGPRLVAHDQPVEESRDALFRRTDAGFTGSVAAIAETGSLVLWPTPAEPRLLSLVPPVHAVLLEAERVFSTLHELMTAEHWAGRLPTNALLISGPSKSADIEQTLAYGVHGPAQLLVLVRMPAHLRNVAEPATATGPDPVDPATPGD